LAALEATLRLYKDPEIAKERIPTLNMILMPIKTIQNRARSLAMKLKKEIGDIYNVSIKKGNSRVGGGASPEKDLPTYLVKLIPLFCKNVEELRWALLNTDPPMIGVIEEDSFFLDVRTLLKQDLSIIPSVLKQAYNFISKD